jgi:hypothetical protein
MRPLTGPRRELFESRLARDYLASRIKSEYHRDAALLGFDPESPPSGFPSFSDYAKAYVEAAPQFTQQFLAQMDQLATQDFEDRAAERAQVAADLDAGWGPPIRKLDQVVSFAEDFVTNWGMALENVRGKVATERTLHMLLSRGVQVGEEVLTLLRGGMAAGAEARWRTLHELAVVSSFVSLHDDEMAEGYLVHGEFKWHRRMLDEHRHHERLGFEPYTKDQLREAEKRVANLKKRYPNPFFKDDYGWAAEALGRRDRNKHKTPRLTDLEKHLDLAHFRPAYASASNAIHAGPAGLLEHPAGETLNKPGFLIRATAHGLREPGVRTAISLFILVQRLTETLPCPMDWVHVSALERIVSATVELFIKAEETEDSGGDQHR